MANKNTSLLPAGRGRDLLVALIASYVPEKHIECQNDPIV
jgi:hypothetical protein